MNAIQFGASLLGAAFFSVAARAVVPLPQPEWVRSPVAVLQHLATPLPEGAEMAAPTQWIDNPFTGGPRCRDA